MYIRCAFFEGKVHNGCEKQFSDFVRDRLLPLWTTFPGAVDVKVLRQKASDTPAPHYAMVLAITYPTLADMDKALQSDVRTKSREVTGELVKMFDGRIFHTVFDAVHTTTIS